MNVGRELAARLIVALALVALGVGSISGTPPMWPDNSVYAAAAWLTALLWFASTVQLAAAVPRRSRALREIADAALLTLALMRCFGFVIDLFKTGDQGLFAAISAWTIIAVLCACPLRHARSR